MAKQYSKLRGRIVEKFGSQREFAAALGKSEQVIVAKLAGRSQFTQDEIITWCNLLEIPADEIVDYFFADLLSNG